MMELFRLREAYMGAAEARWHRAVHVIRGLLTYNLRLPFGAEVRKLTHLLMTSDEGILDQVFGGRAIDFELGYGGAKTHSPIRFMEQIGHFVSHEILDDGTPGIGYYRRSKAHRFDRCLSDADGARAYFHRRIEDLFAFDPSAEVLTLKSAISILEALELDRASTAKKAVEKLASMKPDDPLIRTAQWIVDFDRSKAERSASREALVRDILASDPPDHPGEP